MNEPVAYFPREGMPGSYFLCEQYACTLSTDACARNFLAAPEVAPGGRLVGCIRCSIGALHAGKPVPLRSKHKSACVRCRRSAKDANSIGRLRLVRGHTICVSCFNREREVLKGSNARGTAPRKWRNLGLVNVGAVVAGRMTERRLPVAIDRIEAVLTLARTEGLQAFGWVRPCPVKAAGTSSI